MNLLENAYIDPFTVKLLISTVVTTMVWVSVTLLSQPERAEVLERFVKVVQPGLGWSRFHSQKSNFSTAILLLFVGTIGTYAALFSIGNFIYGNWLTGLLLMGVFAMSSYLLVKKWKKIR